MEPKIPSGRQSPDVAGDEPRPPAKAQASRPADPARTQPAKAAAEPAKAQPAKAAEPTKATQTAKATAEPTKATKTAKATQTAKVAAKMAKAAAEPAKAQPAKAAKATAAAQKAAPKTTATATRATKKAAAKKIATVPVTSAPEPPKAVPTPVWERIKANPRYAPELLASAAVDTIGRQVDGYVRWLVATYPHATPDSIARYAAQRYARQAGYAALAGTLLGGLAEAAALAWAHARLVLLVAAAYGRDPAAAERVPELLVLLRVHPDLRSARAALEASEKPGGSWAGLARALAVPLGGRRLPSRLLPGAGLLLGAIVNSSTTEAVARRAVAYYRTSDRNDT